MQSECWQCFPSDVIYKIALLMKCLGHPWVCKGTFRLMSNVGDCAAYMGNNFFSINEDFVDFSPHKQWNPWQISHKVPIVVLMLSFWLLGSLIHRQDYITIYQIQIEMNCFTQIVFVSEGFFQAPWLFRRRRRFSCSSESQVAQNCPSFFSTLACKRSEGVAIVCSWNFASL